MRIFNNRVIACTGLLILAASLWLYWPTILLSSMHAQQLIYSHFNQLLINLSEHRWQYGWMLVGLSFGYGVFHAVGPGHGKVVMASYLATHRQKWLISLALTMSAALMQALVAIVIVSILRFVMLQSAHQVNRSALEIIHFNSLLVILLGVWLAIRTLYSCYKIAPKEAHSHHDHAHCHCGHAHHVTPEAVSSAHNWRDYAMLVISIGARPCSGAMLILIVSALMGIYWIGLICTVVMAIGTGLTTSALALITVFARTLMIKIYGSHTPHPYLQAAPAILGAILLILLGITLYQMPPLAGIPRFLIH